jgi:hypothetical protein
MSDPYLHQVEQELLEWEARGPSLLTRLSGFLAGPLEHATSMLVPDHLKAAIARSLEQAITSLQEGGPPLVDHALTHARIHERAELVGSDFLARDELARETWAVHVGLASASGFLSGLGGWAGLLLDLPALTLIVLRVCHAIGSCYGYSPENSLEQVYVRHVLCLGTEGDYEARLGFLFELKQLERGLLTEVIGGAAGGAVAAGVERMTARVASEQVGRNLIRGRALQLVPWVSGAVSATLNAVFVHEVASAAFAGYRRRRLQVLKRAQLVAGVTAGGSEDLS